MASSGEARVIARKDVPVANFDHWNDGHGRVCDRLGRVPVASHGGAYRCVAGPDAPVDSVRGDVARPEGCVAEDNALSCGPSRYGIRRHLMREKQRIATTAKEGQLRKGRNKNRITRRTYGRRRTSQLAKGEDRGDS